MADRKERVVIFGEDSLLARGIADALEKDDSYEILNSYKVASSTMPMKNRLSSLAWTDEIDASNVENVIRACQYGTIIINCCGLVNSDKCQDNVYKAFESNTLTAYNVAKICAAFKKKLIHLATTASYGSGVISEQTTNSFFQTAYSGSKLLGESVVKQLLPDALIIRPCFIYGGTRDTSSVIKKLIYRSLKNDHPDWEISLSLSNKKDYLWIDDFSEAVKLLIDQDQSGVFNISKGRPVEYSEILNVLYEFGIKTQNVTWRPDLDYLGDHMVDNSKLTLLGWQAKVDLREGIQKIIDEYQTSNS